MKNRIKKMYDKIRILILYAFAFFIFFILQKYTIGLLPWIRDTLLFGKIYLSDLLFIIVSLAMVKLFVKATIPNKDDKKYLFRIEKIRNSHL